MCNTFDSNTFLHCFKCCLSLQVPFISSASKMFENRGPARSLNSPDLVVHVGAHDIGRKEWGVNWTRVYIQGHEQRCLPVSFC